MTKGPRTVKPDPFSAAQVEALYRAIEVNDVVDLDAAPPRAISQDYSRAQLIDGFNLSLQLWRQGYASDTLAAMIRTLKREGAFSGPQSVAFKHLRAKFKHLRFAFVLYGDNHRCPLILKAITTTMGQVQDAAAGGRHVETMRQASRLNVLLSPPLRHLLEREVGCFKPGDAAGYRRFVAGQIRDLSAVLAAPAATGHRFHAARKIISRQVSFHDDMRTIEPTPEHAAMSRFLAAINGLMGRFHDDLVTRRADGSWDYARTPFGLPEEIRERLTRVVALYN